MEWGQKFLGAGEAFLGEEAVELRAILAETTAKFFDSYHHSNMEVMSSSWFKPRPFSTLC